MRVVVSFVGGWGHAEPLLPVAARAVEAGHEVSFAGQAAVVARLARRGVGTHVVGPDTLATTPQPLAPVDREAERAVMRDHFVADYGWRRSRDLGALYDRVRPGLVVCDEVDVGAVVAAERRGIPCVTVAVIAAGRLLSPGVVGTAWNELRRAAGLPPDPHGARLGGALGLAPQPRSLRSPLAPVPPALRFVRPPILDEVASDEGPPLVYVTLGTVFHLESGDLFTRLVAAANALDHDVVLTTGPGRPAEPLPALGPRVRAEAFVAQRELLGRCRAVVCHGGSGTLVAALSLGVPAVALPMGADQPDNGDRLEELGAGVVLDPLTATPAGIAGAIDAVLHDGRYREAAGALAAEARTQPGLDEVGELASLLGG